MSRHMALAATLAAALLAALSCAPAKKPEEREIVFWQSRPVEVVAPLVAEFERANPGLRVRVERLSGEEGRERILAAVASDSVPDLCEVGSALMPGLLAGGRLADWSAGVADLRPQMLGWEMCSVGDALYGVPWVLTTRALFYDKALFARARLDSTRPPRTWEELRSAAAAVQRLRHGVHGYGVQAAGSPALAREVLSFVWGNGGSVLSDDLRRAVFDSVANLEALDFYLSLRAAGVVGRQDSLDHEFVRGRLGLVLSGPWLIQRIHEEAPRLRYGVALVPRPALDRGAHVSWADGDLLVSFVASRHKHEALQLARFLVEPDHVLALVAATPGALSAVQSADTSAFYRARPQETEMLLQLESARFAPNHPAWDALEAILEDEFGQALLGHQNAAEAVRDAQTRLTERLEEH